MNANSRIRTTWLRVVEVVTVAAFPLAWATVESAALKWTVGILASLAVIALIYPVVRRRGLFLLQLSNPQRFGLSISCSRHPAKVKDAGHPTA